MDVRPPRRMFLLLLFTAGIISPPPPVHGFAESIYHEEVYKKEVDNNDFSPVFLTNEPSKQLYSTPKYCLREPAPTRRAQVKKDGAKQGSEDEHIFVSTWMEFMNEFYWDNGREYTKWTHASEGVKKSELEPWYMPFGWIIPVLLYMLSMLITGILAPFIAFILFRFFHIIWKIVSHNRVRNVLRKLWTCNEIRKRRQVIMIYRWARRFPKLRAQLPWILRRHPDEEVPNALKELIAPSSSAESSIAEDDESYYYDGNEEIEVPKEDKTSKDSEIKKRNSIFKRRKKKGKKVIPAWRRGYRKILAETQKYVEEDWENLDVADVGMKKGSKGIDKKGGATGAIGSGEQGTRRAGSGQDFHI